MAVDDIGGISFLKQRSDTVQLYSLYLWYIMNKSYIFFLYSERYLVSTIFTQAEIFHSPRTTRLNCGNYNEQK